MQELWMDIEGRAAGAPNSEFVTVRLPEFDDEEYHETSGIPSWETQPISGYCCAIRYLDSKQRPSERRITCQRLDSNAGLLYIRAYCHERSALRSFRMDRIATAIDLETGEIFEPGSAFFERFNADSISNSKLGWGLSVNARADLLAGLNALTFMANCDKDWHPAEREAIEAFATSYWIRAEIRADMPIDDIMDTVDRMAPDAETFFVSLTRCAASPILRPIIRRTLGDVIQADGRLHDLEFFWGSKVDQFFVESGS